MCKIQYLKLYIIIMFVIIDIVSSEQSVDLSFVKLVTDFQKSYGPINILIAQGEPYDDFNAAGTFGVIMKQFSQNNVFTTITRIIDLPVRIAYFEHKIDKPFFVIILNSATDIECFKNVTKIISMNSYRLLVIFTSVTMDMCENPKGNPFNLVFNTYMIVKCHNHPVLREWYSLRPNETKVTDLLIWDPNIEGFQWLTHLTFDERRSSLEGISLRVTMMEDIKMVNGKLNGFFGELLTEISQVSNFTIDIQPYEDSVGSYDPTENRWTGIMGKLQEKKTDIGLRTFSITEERLDIIDFSVPIEISNTFFYIRKSHASHVLWSMYYKAIGIKASYYILFILLLSPILLAFTEFRDSNISFVKRVCDNYFTVWGIFCSKTASDPDRISTRTIHYTLYILSFMVYSIYSALLVSYLTIFKPDLPFNSLDEFIMVKTHKITTIRNTNFVDLFKHAKDDSMKRLKNFLLPDDELPTSTEEAIEQMCNAQNNLVLYIDEILLNNRNLKIPCELIPFERGRQNNLALAFVKNSPYVGLINYRLQKMNNFGILNAIERRNFRDPVSKLMIYKAVTLWGSLPMFAILIGGIALSILILICENIIFYFNNKRDKLVHLPN